MNNVGVKFCCFAGLTEMSFVDMKGIPAKISTSNSFTTKASDANSILSLDNIICISPTITWGVIPSACRAL